MDASEVGDCATLGVRNLQLINRAEKILSLSYSVEGEGLSSPCTRLLKWSTRMQHF